MASRMQVATHVADELAANRTGAIRSAAAWLIDAGRARDARYLARDVAVVLAERGHVLVRVTTARPLSMGARQTIEAFVKAQTGARQLELETAIDPALIGGLTIELPGATLDASVRTKLEKFVEGVKL